MFDSAESDSLVSPFLGGLDGLVPAPLLFFILRCIIGLPIEPDCVKTEDKFKLDMIREQHIIL